MAGRFGWSIRLFVIGLCRRHAGCCARLNCFGPAGSIDPIMLITNASALPIFIIHTGIPPRFAGYSDYPGGAYNAVFLGANQLPKWQNVGIGTCNHNGHVSSSVKLDL
jgi:hypothetical protein